MVCIALPLLLQLRPKEILQILSKILNFSEEQNVIVGLSVPPPMHIVASLFQGILGINTQKPSTHGTQQREGPTVEVCSCDCHIIRSEVRASN